MRQQRGIRGQHLDSSCSQTSEEKPTHMLDVLARGLLEACSRLAAVRFYVSVGPKYQPFTFRAADVPASPVPCLFLSSPTRRDRASLAVQLDAISRPPVALCKSFPTVPDLGDRCDGY